MFPLLPFAAGLLTGAVVTRLIKADKARVSLDKAQGRVREATVSSLAALEHTSAELRARLMRTSEEPPASEADSEPQAEAGEPPQEAAAPGAEPGTAAAQATPESAQAAPRQRTARRRTSTKGVKPAEIKGRTEKPDEENM